MPTMNTLSVHKERLQKEIDQAENYIQLILSTDFPDLRAMKQLQDSIKRNRQVLDMLDDHLQQPAWRVKKFR